MIISLLAAFALQTGRVLGDDWSIERVSQISCDAKTLVRTLRTRYTVVGQDTSALLIRCSVTKSEDKGDADLKPVGVGESAPTSLKFGAGGAPEYEEDLSDPIAARVDRMQWTAAESRKGVAWIRKFPASSALPAGKVTVKPAGMDGPNQLVTITYSEESTGVAADGTATVYLPKRIVGPMKISLSRIPLAKIKKVGNVTVEQTLLPPAKNG